MQIFIKTLSGKSIPLDIDDLTTVADVKTKLKDMEGIPVDDQRLIFSGRQLEDTDKLSAHNVVDGSVIHLVLRLR